MDRILSVAMTSAAVAAQPRKLAAARILEKTRGGKVKKPTLHPLGIRKVRGIPLHRLGGCGRINQNRTFHLLRKADVLTC
jgi:hypothetical protein